MTHKEIDLAALVSLIYEKNQSPHLYQGLTPREDNNLAGFDITDEELNSFSAGMLSPELLEEVTPHLVHAVNLMEKQHRSEEAQPFSRTLSFLDLPLPVCLLSDNLSLLQTNNQAQAMLVDGVHLPCKAAQALAIEQQLKIDILTAVTLTTSTNTLHTVSFKTESGVIRTAVVVPQNPSENNTAQQAAVLFLNHESRIHDVAMSLIKTHGLTQSEAEVAAYLAQGLAPEDIANKKNISINTIRTQIKRGFSKTGTTRQSQLVSLVLNGPAVWTTILNHRNPSIQNSTEPTDTIKLTDGRTLSYGDYGPRDGVPVVLFHHLFGSRNDKPADETLLSRLGIRLVIPERPGVGHSCHAPDMTLLSWADDVQQLVDKLGIDRLHVAGLSSGAVYAAAFATILGDRVIKLGMIAGQMPVDELPKGVKVGTWQRFLTTLARRLPSLAFKQLESNYKKLLADPANMLEQYKQKTNPADQLLHRDPKISSIRLQNIQGASTRSASIYARELVRGFQPWGFLVSELKIPVILWHGVQDDLFSFEHVQAMADIIPECTTIFNDDWGHFFPLEEWESIYKTLTA